MFLTIKLSITVDHYTKMEKNEHATLLINRFSPYKNDKAIRQMILSLFTFFSSETQDKFLEKNYFNLF